MYTKEELKGSFKTENLFRLGLLIVGLLVGTNKYGYKATLITVFIIYSFISLATLIYYRKDIFVTKHLKKTNSLECGRIQYHLISIIVILLGLIYLQSKTVTILIASMTVAFIIIIWILNLSVKIRR